jgi:hypothetical protein
VCRSISVGYRILGSEFEVRGLGFRIKYLGFRLSGSEIQVEDIGCRIYDLGFRY